MWDFDRVLFDTDKLLGERKRIMRRHGFSPEIVKKASAFMARLIAQTAARPFSTAFFLESLKRNGARFNEKVLKDDFRKMLVKYQYLDPQAERVLHGLRKKYFVHIIVSWGSAPYQYKKIKTACGSSFLRHFSKIIVTTKPKHSVIGKLTRRFPETPTFFIDDSKEHVALVRKYISRIKTIRYSRGWSLKKVERVITQRVKDK